MTSPVEEIEVECPSCGHVYTDWYRPSINRTLDDFDDEYLEAATTSTCPECDHKVRHSVLTVREVRVGENSYQEARNPELWMELLQGPDDKPLGALAGRILDADGKFEPVENIVLEQLAGPGLPAIDQFYLTTYEKSELRGKSPWEESFGMSDLPPGEYQITFMLNGVQQRVVTVESGKLTMVTFVIVENETN